MCSKCCYVFLVLLVNSALFEISRHSSYLVVYSRNFHKHKFVTHQQTRQEKKFPIFNFETRSRYDNTPYKFTHGNGYPARKFSVYLNVRMSHCVGRCQQRTAMSKEVSKLRRFIHSYGNDREVDTRLQKISTVLLNVCKTKWFNFLLSY